MTTLPYKFAIVLPTVEGRYQWHRFWEKHKLWAGVEAKDPHIRYGMLLKDKERTYRIDICRDYFRPDSTHWARSSVRRKVRKIFPEVELVKLPKVSTIVLIWSNSLYWLDDKKARLAMESWDGRPGESRSLWRFAASLPKWSD
jgi:hypothetical protein